MSLPELTSDMTSMAGSSPKQIAAIAVLRLYERYFHEMATNPNVNIDRMTAAILISCPEDKQREAMWKEYCKLRDDEKTGEEQLTRVLTASVMAVGKWYQYMSNAMGLNEKSTGGG